MFSVQSLSKDYGNGAGIRGVSFSLERGYITGFVGANGAGKTTTLKSMLNVIRRDGGTVTAFGLDLDGNEEEIKSRIGFSSGAFDYYPYAKVGKIAKMYASFYKNWDESRFSALMQRFSLSKDKRVKELSAGMRVKLAISLAMAHKAELLVFDEPTSGLDPVARDELLDIFTEVVESGEVSILFSTHITSDLDKCADFIMVMQHGELVASGEKDAVLDEHALVTGGADELTDELKSELIGYKSNAFGFTGLMKAEKAKALGLSYTRPNLEEITVFYNRKEH